ncbi:hypothetical protein TpMuguga_03g00602 [Theileria parva strain Muguga]|uniref:Porin n=1 Tax=Theileria parva TaxID=5875 RepID=Q4N0Z5_THEPA|nr:uncharacterized protein TpMuguga_03g00602 [Theileria parva strain Muguga]EAN31347.1 hypothetical protein TpMuguga_03g00602 [Theileria parva strain Muguga]|eukprot:XP_763630.1 hypothetical protein [Theileria parva strain Muguga]
MSTLKFEKLLAGPSVDLFEKDFPHNNVWHVETLSKEPTLDMSSDFRLTRGEELAGLVTLKNVFHNFATELSLNSTGVHHLDVTTRLPFFPDATVGSKYLFDTDKNHHHFLLSSQVENKLLWSRLELKPLDFEYNFFSLLRFGSMHRCLLGAEVSGQKLGKLNVTVGSAYKREFGNNNFLLALRLFGNKDEYLNRLVGNVHVSKNESVKPAVLGVSFEHLLKEKKTKLAFGAHWNLTTLDDPHASFVKAKVDNEARVALSFCQKFNSLVTFLFGFDFNGKSPLHEPDVNYGLKLTLKT